jgi:hypothetical protein
MLGDPHEQSYDVSSLRDLYELVECRFPGCEHDPTKFQEMILGKLKEDPLRTLGVKKSILSKGLDFQIQRGWPLNDFLYGAEGYLVTKGISLDEIGKFERDVLDCRAGFTDEKFLAAKRGNIKT